jgi:phosphoglycolate phosphatase-like HAD superfamily hydrolase
VKKIRAEVFANDSLITLLKERGVNSNWDLAYGVFAYMLSGHFSSYEDVFNYISQNPDLLAFDIYEECAHLLSEKTQLPVSDCGRNEKLWIMCRDVFQEWYLGSAEFEKMYNKAPVSSDKVSMEEREIPVIDEKDIYDTLSALHASGKKLLIATGRSTREVSFPLDLWNIRSFFEPNGIATYTYIEDCERKMAECGIAVQLTKPEPYIFLKALYGTDYPDEKILSDDYDSSLIKKALIIGDAGSDILAAKKMGCDFLAVLTGVSGEKAKSYFEEQHAEYIFPSVREMIDKID